MLLHFEKNFEKSWSVPTWQILLLTDRSPKWLLKQVHPDRNIGREAQAADASQRVSQAMAMCGYQDVRSTGLED